MSGIERYPKHIFFFICQLDTRKTTSSSERNLSSAAGSLKSSWLIVSVLDSAIESHQSGWGLASRFEYSIRLGMARIAFMSSHCCFRSRGAADYERGGKQKTYKRRAEVQ